jgi:hypothetical protein
MRFIEEYLSLSKWINFDSNVRRVRFRMVLLICGIFLSVIVFCTLLTLLLVTMGGSRTDFLSDGSPEFICSLWEFNDKHEGQKCNFKDKVAPLSNCTTPCICYDKSFAYHCPEGWPIPLPDSSSRDKQILQNMLFYSSMLLLVCIALYHATNIINIISQRRTL